MNIEGTINKVLNPVMKNGELIGVGLFLMEPTAIPSIMETVERVTKGGIHGVDFGKVANYLLRENTRFMPAVGAAVAGYILKDATGNPTISKLGEIMQKVGTGLAATTAVYGVAYYATHSPAPANMVLSDPRETSTSQTQSAPNGLRFITS